MGAPFPVIPSTAVPFWCEDSFSLMVEPGNPWRSDPGCVNTLGTIPASSTVTAWLIGGEFTLVPEPNSGTMFNVDVQMQLYDLSGGNAVGTGIMLTMGEPYGASSDPQMMSVSVSDVTQPTVRRPWSVDAPLVLQAKVPSIGGPFLIGPAIFFNSGLTDPWRCEYCYYLQGAWQAQ